MKLNTDAERIAFAQKFVFDRMITVRKDIRICLTATRLSPTFPRTHAYMPALITCVSTLEFLAGLMHGTLNFTKSQAITGSALAALKNVRQRFAMPSAYASPNLEILYLAIRHKMAHAGRPDAIFDSSREKKLGDFPHMRFSYQICARRRSGSPAIELQGIPHQEFAPDRTPFQVFIDHMLIICLYTLHRDVAALGDRYRSLLATDQPALVNFFSAMHEYYAV